MEGVAVIAADYKGVRVLVTGHTGFKGSWLSLWLSRLGARVTGLSLDPPTEPNLWSLVADGVLQEDVRADVRDRDALAAVVRRAEPEIVFHLAAQPLVRLSYAEPKLTFDTNVGGTVNLLDALRDVASVRAIVIVTTDKCYENREWVHAYRENDPLGGHDPYSASKACAEIASAAYRQAFLAPRGVGLATARAGNVIGGGDWALDRIVPDMVRALGRGEPVGVRHPEAVRPWQHVLEPVYGYLLLGGLLAGDPGRYAGAWNFGPAPTSFNPVRKVVASFLAEYGSGRWEDLSAANAAAVHEAGLLTLASDKAYHQLGWRPRWDFGETIARTSRWYGGWARGEDARTLCLNDIDAYTEGLDNA